MKMIMLIGFFAVFGFAVLAWAVGQGGGNDIRPGSGVAMEKRLSDYLPSLVKTPGDTSVYFMNGKEPGATVLVAGGTHGNEIAGIMAATILVEHGRVQKGRLIVILDAYDETAPANRSVKLLDVPGLQQVMASGAGAFLR